MKIQMRYDAPPRDSELIQNGRQKELPGDHWCRGCDWATCLMDRFLCPFIEGSCARFPETILEPHPDMLAAEMHKRKPKEKAEPDCPRDGKFAKQYSIQGETHSVKVWAYLMGISESTIYSRLRAGMTPEQAILTPLQREK